MTTAQHTRETAGRVSYLRWAGPAGATPILFLHPVNTAGEVWSAMAATVSADRTCLAVDLRGHGASGPGTSYLPQDYAHDALAALEHAGIGRVHVVGGSLGGAIAVELAALAGERVRSIALFGASLHIGYSAAEVEALVAAVRQVGVEGFFRAHGADVLGPAGLPTAADELVRLAVGGAAGTGEVGGGDPAPRSTDTVAAIVRAAFHTADSRPTARTLRPVPPSMVAVGTHDPTCPPAMARKLAAALGTEPVEMEGIGHLPMIEDPVASAAMVRRFLTSVEQDGAA